MFSINCFAITTKGDYELTSDGYLKYQYNQYSNDAYESIYFFLYDLYTFETVNETGSKVVDHMLKYDLPYLIVFGDSQNIQVFISDYASKMVSSEKGLEEYSWQHDNYAGSLTYYVEGDYVYIKDDTSNLFTYSSSKGIGAGNTYFGSNYNVMDYNNPETVFFSKSLMLTGRFAFALIPMLKENVSLMVPLALMILVMMIIALMLLPRFLKTFGMNS